MKHVVMFSGGIGSWATAKRVVEAHGSENLVLLFADVKGNSEDPHIGEDEDTYRFIRDAAENVGGELVVVKDGRNIWEVFKDDRFLGNARLANCSKFLKQRPCREWLEANCPDGQAVVYVGIDWSETHRLPAIEKAYLPYVAKAPLTEPPFIDKAGMIEWAEREGLKPPRLYAQGFAHNNCGGGCVRAGQGQFKMLLAQNPERYASWEENEQQVRDHLGKDVAILRDRRGGVSRPMTLREFRERQEAKNPPKLDEFQLFDLDDHGGCGCFVDETEVPKEVAEQFDGRRGD